ncbi:hypothetical protein DFR50_101295 [Roseiarcus fermentans]|uniref:Uncharacterized protein n=1 Tax=Roseiarcus fermentans TaxID=1473586 RepID=A0A366FWE8_9HYPH|nr:hypothetical protein DFR50_101295 [Roseiarcus fermentans]
MMWKAIEASWKRFRTAFALTSFGAPDSDRAGLDVVGTDLWRVGQRDDTQPEAYHPDERARRSEFSQHIGC